jgi:TPR repeat protein
MPVLLEVSEMIISNRFVRTYSFGSKVARIHNKSFQCCVSTAKEGLFQKLSTIILEPKLGNTVGAGAAGLRLCGKIIYPPALRKSDRLQLHDTLAKTLDASGEEGCTLEEALDRIELIFPLGGPWAECALIRAGNTDWCLEAAEQGDADAQSMLECLYKNGRSVHENAQAVAWYRKAAVWCRMAAKQGDADAQSMLGYLYENGRGVPQDYAQAAAWYRKAAEQGNVKAQYGLGGLYRYGLGVPQDYAEACFWSDIANALSCEREEIVREERKAGRKRTRAELNAERDGLIKDLDRLLAIRLRRSKQLESGVNNDTDQHSPEDYTRLAASLREAAERGDAEAQYNLGRLYFEVQDVPQHHAQAAAWYRKAAEQGNADAQYNLGGLYRYGLGVPQDYLQAYFWFEVAAAGKLNPPVAEFVAKCRDEIASLLAPADLFREQERVREWFEAHQAKPQ